MSSSDTESLTPDSVFELLSNHRRRMVLYYLRRNGGSVGMQELAKQIASMENDVPADELTSQQRKRVYVSLYQTHLPKMAEMDTIDYDKESGIVRLTERADDIDEYLTTNDRSTYPWTFHYLLLVIAGGDRAVFVRAGRSRLRRRPDASAGCWNPRHIRGFGRRTVLADSKQRRGDSDRTEPV
ncbi:hypothetical protein [Halorubrum sp. CBA1125]|uniref:DUF7344 domain-containing protein n=1 Tax=Halorubrum sp. CBA1125 TaxID=2668072 RepID=UPI001E52B9EF|nr:hypothetical protein [Halorubrum sp. CBA1125]